jgi:hypothetical protein
MEKIFFKILLNPWLQFLAEGSSAEKHPKMVMKAPETLDIEQLQSWINGSVWALLALNLIALGIFLLNTVDPQLRGLFVWLKQITKKTKQPNASATETIPTTAPVDASPVVAPPPAQTAAVIQPPAAVTVSISNPTILAPEPDPSAPFIKIVDEPAPAAAQSAEPTAEPPMIQIQEEVQLPPPEPEKAVSEIVEEFDLPKIPESELPPVFQEESSTIALSEAFEASASTATPPSPVTDSPAPPVSDPSPGSPAEITEVIPKKVEESKPLPPSSVSETVEPLMGSIDDSLPSLEETITEALSTSSEATEEIAIFDPKLLDNVLKEDHKK